MPVMWGQYHGSLRIGIDLETIIRVGVCMKSLSNISVATKGTMSCTAQLDTRAHKKLCSRYGHNHGQIRAGAHPSIIVLEHMFQTVIPIPMGIR